MQDYVSLTGVWLRVALGPQLAALPQITPKLNQAWDLIYAPVFAVVGTRIPPEALKHLKGFIEERQVRRVITGKRVATAWIGKDFILGAEATAATKEAGTPGNQFHPMTAHWQTQDGKIAWLRLTKAPRGDASVEKSSVMITGTGDYTFRLQGSGVRADSLQRAYWAPPGLAVRVDTDAASFSVSPGDGFVDISYGEATKFHLQFEKKQP